MADNNVDGSARPMPVVFAGHGNPMNALDRDGAVARA